MIEIVTAALLAIVLQGDAPVVGSVEVCPGVLRVEHLVDRSFHCLVVGGLDESD